MSFYAYLRAGEARYQERFGLDFEEFAVGQRFKHRPGVTLSQQDNLDEALDTLNAAMLHYDAHYAAQTTWKRPLMVSTVTIQRVIGMASRTFGRKQAILGFAEIALTGPVFGGDTLYAESEIAGVRDGGADHGIVTVISRGVTPEGREVARLTYDVAVYRRGRHPDEIGRPAAPPAEEERFMLYATLPDGTLLEHYGIFFEDARAGRDLRPLPAPHLLPRRGGRARAALARGQPAVPRPVVDRAPPGRPPAHPGDVAHHRRDRRHHPHLRARRREPGLDRREAADAGLRRRYHRSRVDDRRQARVEVAAERGHPHRRHAGVQPAAGARALLSPESPRLQAHRRDSVRRRTPKAGYA